MLYISILFNKHINIYGVVFTHLKGALAPLKLRLQWQVEQMELLKGFKRNSLYYNILNVK